MGELTFQNGSLPRDQAIARATGSWANRYLLSVLFVRQARPDSYIRQSRSHIRQSRPHIRQSPPHASVCFQVIVLEISQRFTSSSRKTILGQPLPPHGFGLSVFSSRLRAERLAQNPVAVATSSRFSSLDPNPQKTRIPFSSLDPNPSGNCPETLSSCSL